LRGTRLQNAIESGAAERRVMAESDRVAKRLAAERTKEHA
jgi:hypothetical protein